MGRESTPKNKRGLLCLPLRFRWRLWDYNKTPPPSYIFEYSIDGNINGKLIGTLQGFNAYSSPPRNNGVNFTPSSRSLDYNTKNAERAGNSIENLKKFYLGLKSGKKLMIRITDYIYDDKNDEIKWGPYNIKKHTYIFDLKGSSKALSF